VCRNYGSGAEWRALYNRAMQDTKWDCAFTEFGFPENCALQYSQIP